MRLLTTFLTFTLVAAICFSQVPGRPASETYVTSKINSHASTNNAHADIRASVFAATTNINALAIDMTNVTEKANAAILKNTQQDVDISNIYASNANAIAIANLANTRAQAANVTNAQNTMAITSVSNMVVQVKVTADAAATTSFVAQAVSNAIASIPPSSGGDSSRIVTADGTRWIDATGGVWRVTESVTGWTVIVPTFGITFTITNLPPPELWLTAPHVPNNYYFQSQDYELQVMNAGDNHNFILVSGAGDYYETGGINVTGSETDGIPVTFIPLYSTHELPNASLAYNYGGAITSCWNEVAMKSDIATQINAALSDLPSSGVASFGGSATNLSLYGPTTLRNAAPTNLVLRLYLSNDVLYAEHISE
jgi:hypothetical protein